MVTAVVAPGLRLLVLCSTGVPALTKTAVDDAACMPLKK
jgi:hypothetical protein